MKKILIQYYKGKPVDVIEVKDLSQLEINILKKQCEKNYTDLCESQEKKEKALNERIEALDTRIAEQELLMDEMIKEIRVLKGEE